MSKYIANHQLAGEAIHPGVILKEELQNREIKQKDFAEKMGVRPNVLNELLNGKRHISAQIAVKLEELLGISAEFWMRLQSHYEIDLVRIKLKNQIEKTDLSSVQKQNLIRAIV